MAVFIGTDVATDPDDAVERVEIDFRAMSSHDLANATFGAGVALKALHKPAMAAAVFEASDRIREPSIGRWPVLFIGIVIGGTIAAAALTAFERSPSNAAKKADRMVMTWETVR